MTKHFLSNWKLYFLPKNHQNNFISSEHAWLPHSPVVFITTLDYRRGPNGELTSKTVALNYGGTFNPTSGVFQAPETGCYLFLVTLDFERGLSLAVLKRSGVPVASLRQEQGEKRGPVSRASLLELRQGETVTLELMHGSLRKSQLGDNTLSGLLLFITEHKDMLWRELGEWQRLGRIRLSLTHYLCVTARHAVFCMHAASSWRCKKYLLKYVL